MPKQKTSRAAKKRFKITATGKVIKRELVGELDGAEPLDED